MDADKHIEHYTLVRDTLQAELSLTVGAYEGGFAGFFDPETGKNITPEHIEDLKAQIEKANGWIAMWEKIKDQKGQ